MARDHQKGGDPSHRMLRIGELVRHTLSDLLMRGTTNDPVLDGHSITVADVKMSPDLKLATAYIMPLGGRDKGAVIEALEKQRKTLRSAIAQRIDTKFAPDIRFKIDDSFGYGAKIDSILESPEVRRDLAKTKDDDQP